MNENQTVDYQSALELLRRVENIPDNPVRSTGKQVSAPTTDGYVDYLSVVKSWDEMQANQYIIHENI